MARQPGLVFGLDRNRRIGSLYKSLIIYAVSVILVVNYVSRKDFPIHGIFVILHCLSSQSARLSPGNSGGTSQVLGLWLPFNPRVFLWKHKSWGLSPTRKRSLFSSHHSWNPTVHPGGTLYSPASSAHPPHLSPEITDSHSAEDGVSRLFRHLTWLGDQQNQTTLSCVKKIWSLFKSFSNPFIHQTSHAECCIFTSSFSK